MPVNKYDRLGLGAWAVAWLVQVSGCGAVPASEMDSDTVGGSTTNTNGLGTTHAGGQESSGTGPGSDAGDAHESATVDDADQTSGGPMGCTPSDSGVIPDRPHYGVWTKVEPEGTRCSDGSQYKFFVKFSRTSNDLLVAFEPGGACWDYETCSGRSARGAANPKGIPDDHMELDGNRWALAYPLFGHPLIDAQSPFADWNQVFLPYCTGDVHWGDRSVVYQDPVTDDELVYHHEGRKNSLAAIAWMRQQFAHVPRLFVTGCSAGGVGALLAYPFLRSQLDGVQCGYLLNDSGPIFSSDGPSGPLHTEIRSRWNVEQTLSDLAYLFGQPSTELIARDFGQINTWIADGYPQDRLAMTQFKLDFVFSLYAYDDFYEELSPLQIHDMWAAETLDLAGRYDTRANLGYFLPYFRPDNCSHCTTIIALDHLEEIVGGRASAYVGTAIESANIDLRGYVDNLLDDAVPLASVIEDEQPGEGFSEEQWQSCRGEEQRWLRRESSGLREFRQVDEVVGRATTLQQVP